MKEYNEFLKLLNEEKRYESIKYITNLANQKYDLVKIYEEILGPSLNSTNSNNIIEEHIKTGIIRNIIEVLYPYVYESRKATDKKALVLCPSEEFHELGARIVNDFLMLLGFNSTYIGPNTPASELLEAIKLMKPDLIAISVTNYYNLVTLKSMIEEVKEKYPSIKILVGGGAFDKNNCHTSLGADYCAKTYAEIKELVGDLC